MMFNNFSLIFKIVLNKISVTMTPSFLDDTIFS